MSVATSLIDALVDTFPEATFRQLARYAFKNDFGTDASQEEVKIVREAAKALQTHGLVDLRIVEIDEPLPLAAGPLCRFVRGECSLRRLKLAARTPASLEEVDFQSTSDEFLPVEPLSEEKLEDATEPYTESELRATLLEDIEYRRRKYSRKIKTPIIRATPVALKAFGGLVERDAGAALDAAATSRCVQVGELYFRMRYWHSLPVDDDSWIHGTLAGPIRGIKLDVTPDAIIVNEHGHFRTAVYLADANNLDCYIRVLRRISEKNRVDCYLW